MMKDIQIEDRPPTRYRWVVVALLFAATAINYVDRQMIGVLKPTLSAEMAWSETDYANIVFWFQAAYAVGYLGFGRIVDLVGARFGYAIAVVIWTIAHMAHGGVHSVTQFAMARFGLGVGESGNFPAGIKAVTEWFPQKERAFAIGLFNAGANIGAIVTPLLVPWLTVAYGWRVAFYATGIFGVLWLIAWLALYRKPEAHKKISAEELAYIRQDPADPVQPIGWGRLITVRETWAYAIGKFCIDPIWWFFLFWLPGYLGTRYGLDLLSFGPPLVAIYLLSDLGSVAGGWMSGRLMKAGKSVNAARKLTMLLCACAVLPVFFAQSIDNLWVAVLIIGIATAAHQAFSANLYTLPSDLFPRGAVGSVVGIGGTVGAMGGMAMAKYAGYVLDSIGSYTPLFAVAASAYFVALAAVHLLSPRLERVSVASE
ncbi:MULTISPECIES: MFS transporter [Sphingobium]|jgi:ACS family hexuronate transporter-like MFS transporter|uniref:MFS transporter n=1 Tax=Sphingobium limneticum TaxID=1007511 RepID=A0A5J5IA29_9SPHN|nr:MULTISPECIES: MFS transporter [Sphingobium]KAA9020288.1 MFS transporter [Sphingobium limneticum]KAA9021232.1 MFS transporter [Sphingobium limneticum]KAA9033593.1 MFS transporter [Sphingobium limneticum]